MHTIVKQRALGALLAWFDATGRSGCTVMLHPICCEELKFMLLEYKCKLVYVDIDPITLCASRVSIEKVSSQIRIDIFLNVRSFGYSGVLEPLFEQVRHLCPGILIIDDRCLCKPVVPSSQQGMQGSADIELYSTGYSKYVDLGFGGYLIASETFKLDVRTNYLEKEHEKFKPSDNFPLKIHPLAWVDDRDIEQEDYFDLINNKLKIIEVQKNLKNKIYLDRLSNNSTLRILPQHLDWRFQLISDSRELLKEKIFSAGYFCSSHYIPDPLGAAVSDDMVEAKKLSSGILNLFNDFRVTENDVLQIGEIINNELN